MLVIGDIMATLITQIEVECEHSHLILQDSSFMAH